MFEYLDVWLEDYSSMQSKTHSFPFVTLKIGSQCPINPFIQPCTRSISCMQHKVSEEEFFDDKMDSLMTNCQFRSNYFLAPKVKGCMNDNFVQLLKL